jgi:hypothetical protein
MKLYHAGFEEIRKPDVRYGRRNADFGQGFYMSAEEEFAKRWARIRRGQDTVLNSYELDLSGLRVHRFERNEEWFAYIFANRNHQADRLADADVIQGPIANDTIYDTFGIITSGFLTPQQAMRLLMIGPSYEQTVIKTEKAASQLRFIASEVLDPAEVAGYRRTVAEEEAAYQKALGEMLDQI